MGGIDRMMLCFQPFMDEPGESHVVFHNKNSHEPSLTHKYETLLIFSA